MQFYTRSNVFINSCVIFFFKFINFQYFFNFLQIYLSQYGYLSPKARNPSSGGNLLAQDAWENAIREFQGFAGLNITGMLKFGYLQFISPHVSPINFDIYQI